ncbi:MAG: AbrB family transcriptional regulator [Pseudomonadota bacterium]
MSPRFFFQLAGHLLLGAVGGLAGAALGLPMPFLLGALAAVAPLIIWQGARGVESFSFPRELRHSFVGVIGTMIGARFSPDLVAKVPTIWVSLLAVAGFVVAAHMFAYLVYRRVAGYDRATSLYGAMPGGLIEGVSLGEQAGGNVMLLTVHHFARIVIVVITVPLLFVLLSGEVVGSAAGLSAQVAESGWQDVLLIGVIAVVGMKLGRLVRLPAGQIMGPLLMSAILHAFGVVDVESPFWLLALAQLIVGTGLATQFAGATPRILVRAFGLTLLAVSGMFVFAGIIALGVARVTVMDFPAAFISFAPGGVAEMGLIALSLDASPVLVAVHHLVRIMLTVVFVRYADRYLRRADAV